MISPDASQPGVQERTTENRRQTGRPYSVVELDLIVGESLPIDEPSTIGATLFVPNELPVRTCVLIAVPGATYNRTYWDMRPAGREHLSQARYSAERGIVFVSLDYMGAADSSRPADGDRLTLPVIADAAHECVLQLQAGFAEGSFGVPALENATYVGLGQSFGGNVVVIQQARHGDYAAVSTFGSSATALDNIPGMELPPDWDDLTESQQRDVVRGLNTKVLGGELDMYHGIPRDLLMESFYGSDPDPERLRYDTAEIETLLPRMAGFDVATPGFTGRFAAEVCCPVLLGFGDNDIVANPHAEAQAYAASHDVTISVFPNMSHMHNFFENRRLAWDRLLSWLHGLALAATSAR